MKKKILVLGGGLLQVPLIKKAREKGCEVFLSDYYEDPPGKKYAHCTKRISSVSVDENYLFALENQVGYLMTIGTDQPVYTAAKVSAGLNLPHPITEEQGLLVTNKQYMKKRMTENMIPTPAFKVVSGVPDLRLQGLKYPLVMKPVDSQGQRGVFILNGRESAQEILDLFETSRSHSLTGTVILEEFCPGDEITVNCWIREGQAFILMVTDRLHFDDTVALGICKEQRFPSMAAAGREEEIHRVVQMIADSFGIRHGPLYVQMVVNERETSVIEFGYRIGGGFESETIPRVTGIDILELYFNLVAEGRNDFDPGEVRRKARVGSICFMLSRPGKAAKIVVPEGFASLGKLFIREGQELGSVENATSRVGCFAFYTDDPAEYHGFISRYDAELAILNEEGEDILIHNLWQ